MPQDYDAWKLSLRTLLDTLNELAKLGLEVAKQQLKEKERRY